MKNCRLCRVHPANKKGSHIVPHFLLKRIENIEGKTGRDYELGFIIKEFDISSHFGRSVPTKNLDNVFGELTDDELSKNLHPLVVDYFFCSDCESRLAEIENAYAPSLNIRDSKIYSSKVPSEYGLLFWMSVIWRMSINNKSGVQLSSSQEEKLRRVLNISLKLKIAEVDIKQVQAIKEAKRLSYRLLRSPEFSKENGTHMVWHPRFKHPYSLVIDEYLIFFSFKDNYNDLKRMTFFGLGAEVLEAPINKFSAEELIKPITEASLKQVSENVIEEIRATRIKHLNLFWDKLHVSLGFSGRQMPFHIKKEIFEQMIDDEKKMGRKHTLDDLRATTLSVLSKYLVKK